MIPSPLPKNYIFDLDGTLVDSAPDLAHALNHVLKRLGKLPVPLEDVRHLTGHGARPLIERGLSLNGMPSDDADIDRELGHFLDYYAANIAVDTRPYPGAVELLDLLREQGAKVGLCTNKSERLTRLLLDALELTDYFDAILGGDTLPVRKPDPGHVLGTIEALGGQPQETLYFGDTITDFEACKGAQVPIILVRFGYSRLPVEDFKVNGLISSYEEVIHRLRGGQA